MMFMQCRPTPIRSTMGSMSKAVQRVRTASKAMSKNKIKTEYQRDLRNAEEIKQVTPRICSRGDKWNMK
jgi:hypothetical protein